MMKKDIQTIKRVGLALLLYATLAPAMGNAQSALLNEYLSQGAKAFSAARGEALWKKTYINAKSGQKRSCTTCHTDNLRQKGKHARTGKIIEPMAPSVNPKRFTDRKKVEKWFRRNCKWTMGRVCSPQEKGDILTYLSQQ